MFRRKVKILWVSRHDPIPAQLDWFRENIGDYELIRVSGFQRTAEDLLDIILKKRAKFVVPLLPHSFLARLAEYQSKFGFVILYPVMRFIHQSVPEPCKKYDPYRDVIVEPGPRHYRFEKFCKYLGFEPVLLPLKNSKNIEIAIKGMKITLSLDEAVSLARQILRSAYQ